MTPTKTRTVALQAATWQKLRIIQAVRGCGVMEQIEKLIDQQYEALVREGLPPILGDGVRPSKKRGAK